MTSKSEQTPRGAGAGPQAATMSVRIMPERETLLAWMSAFLDGELATEQEHLLQQAMDDDPELLALFEALCAAAVPVDAQVLAPEEASRLASRIMHDLDPSHERLLSLASAAYDGELAAAEQAEAIDLLTPERLPGWHAMLATAEAAAMALRAPEADPAAAKAGAAALSAVEALLAQEATQGQAAESPHGAATSRPETLFDAVSLGTAPLRAAGRSPWRGWRLWVPVAACVVAWVGVLSWQREAPGPVGDPASSLTAQLPMAATPDDTWEVIGDNAAEVQALEAGTHMAAVFATDEHQITVIWLAEPESDSPETGT